jgi:hypothetical protein
MKGIFTSYVTILNVWLYAALSGFLLPHIRSDITNTPGSTVDPSARAPFYVFNKKNIPRLSQTDMIELYHLRSFEHYAAVTQAGAFSVQTSGIAMRSTETSKTIVLVFEPQNYTTCFLPIVGPNSTVIWNQQSQISYATELDIAYWQESTFLANVNGVVYANYIKWVEDYLTDHPFFNPHSVCSTSDAGESCFTKAQTWDNFVQDSLAAFAELAVQMHAILPPRVSEVQVLSFKEPMRFLPLQVNLSTVTGVPQKPSYTVNDDVVDPSREDGSSSGADMQRDARQTVSEDESDGSRTGGKQIKQSVFARKPSEQGSRNLRKKHRGTPSAAPTPTVFNVTVSNTTWDAGGAGAKAENPQDPLFVMNATQANVASYYVRLITCMQAYQLESFASALQSCMSENIAYLPNPAPTKKTIIERKKPQISLIDAFGWGDETGDFDGAREDLAADVQDSESANQLSSKEHLRGIRKMKGVGANENESIDTADQLHTGDEKATTISGNFHTDKKKKGSSEEVIVEAEGDISVSYLQVLPRYPFVNVDEHLLTIPQAETMPPVGTSPADVLIFAIILVGTVFGCLASMWRLKICELMYTRTKEIRRTRLQVRAPIEGGYSQTSELPDHKRHMMTSPRDSPSPSPENEKNSGTSASLKYGRNRLDRVDENGLKSSSTLAVAMTNLTGRLIGKPSRSLSGVHGSRYVSVPASEEDASDEDGGDVSVHSGDSPLHAKRDSRDSESTSPVKPASGLGHYIEHDNDGNSSPIFSQSIPDHGRGGMTRKPGMIADPSLHALVESQSRNTKPSSVQLKSHSYDDAMTSHNGEVASAKSWLPKYTSSNDNQTGPTLNPDGLARPGTVQSSSRHAHLYGNSADQTREDMQQEIQRLRYTSVVNYHAPLQKPLSIGRMLSPDNARGRDRKGRVGENGSSPPGTASKHKSRSGSGGMDEGSNQHEAGCSSSDRINEPNLMNEDLHGSVASETELVSEGTASSDIGTPPRVIQGPAYSNVISPIKPPPTTSARFTSAMYGEENNASSTQGSRLNLLQRPDSHRPISAFHR